MPRLDRQEAERRLKGLSGWALDGDAIEKQFTFKDFPEAIAFVNRLAPEAESRRSSSRHPDQLQARHADLFNARRRRIDDEGL